MAGLVDSLKGDHDAIVQFLREQGEPSFVIAMESTASKVLLLAGASHLEQELQQVLSDFYHEVTHGNPRAVEFVNNKAVRRQFHTFFNWDANNANQFFGLFGTEFKNLVLQLLTQDVELEGNIRSFVQLGALRNQLVHQNYAAFRLDKTADEVFRLYQSAQEFVRRLPKLLRQTGIDPVRAAEK
jgi:hypothetical protein